MRTNFELHRVPMRGLVRSSDHYDRHRRGHGADAFRQHPGVNRPFFVPLMMPAVVGLSSPASAASNSPSGTSPSFCQSADWSLVMPRSERVGDAVASSDRVVPRLVPGSAAPFAFSIFLSNCPALRSARVVVEPPGGVSTGGLSGAPGAAGGVSGSFGSRGGPVSGCLGSAGGLGGGSGRARWCLRAGRSDSGPPYGPKGVLAAPRATNGLLWGS